MVTLGIHLGARLGELMAIKRDDLNLSPNSFFVKLRNKGQDVKVEVRPNHVLIPRSKYGKPRTIPLKRLRRLALLHIYFVERGAQPSRQLLRVVIRPEMHEEQVRRIRKHVAVERRHFNTVIA